MKHSPFFIAVALLLTVACTKSETGEQGKSISFQTASLLSKAILSGTEFPKSETFGVYAWSDLVPGGYFMENELVSFYTQDALWKPSKSYYWPKRGTVDFIAYYPHGMNGITVEPTRITYTDINVWALQHDIMYADKAAGYTDGYQGKDYLNADDGVPTVFHHALSRIKVQVLLGYDHMEEGDGTVTDWEVTLNSMTLSGIKTTGSLSLELSPTPTEGIIPWVRPQGRAIWDTEADEISAMECLTAPQQLSAAMPCVALGETLVVPQELESGRQTASLSFSVKTKRNGVTVLNEPDIQVHVNLFSATIPAWEMNHSVVYTLNILPAGGGSELKPLAFDPAVGNWENDLVSTTINLGQ